MQGITTGVQGVVRGVIGGGFESISTMTGSMYRVIKQTSGGEDTREDQASNLLEGIYYGLKGIGLEVYSGAKGLIIKPI